MAASDQMAGYAAHLNANTPASSKAKPVTEIAPTAFVWLLDWDRIEDHWDFWVTPAFPPVIGAITKLFTPGRPLVRHYDFGDSGMLDRKVEVARIVVWDDGVEGKDSRRAKSLGNAIIGAVDCREAYAVDLDDSTWWLTLLGYESEKDAIEAEVKRGPDAVDHVFNLRYVLLE